MRIIILTLVTLLLTGCFHNAVKVTGDPQKTITLEEAFRSIGASLQALEKAKGDKMLGIATSEIEVKFNISSKAVDTSKLEAGAEATSKISSSNETTNITGGKETTNNNSDNSSSTNSESSESDGGKISSSTSNSGKDGSTSETSNSTTNTSKISAETGSTVSLKAEIGSSVEGSRSNAITVKLVSLPALIKGLNKEQIELLKHVGYFKKDQIQTNANQVFFMVPETPANINSNSSQPVIFSVPMPLDIKTKQGLIKALNSGVK